jgi:CIC family chloride channel protein
MALFVPQVLGVGYGYVGDALNGRMALGIMAVLVILKLLAVTTSYGSGNAGGIFGPSLFIGAMLGGTVGGLAHQLLPHHTASAGAYALVGMGTLFAGIIRAPMTSVLMIFETTQDYAVIVPLMISNLVSFFISTRLQREPIYDALAVQDGIHLPSAATRHQRGERQVVQLLRAPEEVLGGAMQVGEALMFAAGSRFNSWPVCDERGVIGVVSKLTLEQASQKQKTQTQLKELVNPRQFPHLHADQSLHQALERMGNAGLDRLPVVSRADVHKLEGILQLQDVLESYGIASRDRS